MSATTGPAPKLQLALTCNQATNLTGWLILAARATPSESERAEIAKTVAYLRYRMTRLWDAHDGITAAPKTPARGPRL